MEDVDILLNLYLSKFQYLKIIILSKLHTFLSTDVYMYMTNCGLRIRPQHFVIKSYRPTRPREPGPHLQTAALWRHEVSVSSQFQLRSHWSERLQSATVYTREAMKDMYTKCSIFLQSHPAYRVQVWGMAFVETSVPPADVRWDKTGPARACSSHHSPSTTSYSLSHQPSYSRNVIILAVYVAVIHSNSPQPLSIQGQDTSPPARLDQDYPAWGR